MKFQLHRRTFYDDHCGVDEALDEPGVTGDGLVVRGRHWILLDTPDHSSKMHRPLAFELYHSPVLSFAPLNMPIEQYRASYNTLYSGLTRSLPDHLNIATLEQWTGKSLLLRLEHIYQNNEDTTLSQPVTVDVEVLFSHSLRLYS
ncbi:unnamed protein product [Anisakis simplex]|uniref:Glyco_hydro38C2 domain-containing protein n=1 Tax=Anisakis simplex TaxID=6269 RepID=A0A0M3JFV3_ANISI|nr:unnamed protein product [Anisakis simplex]